MDSQDETLMLCTLGAGISVLRLNRPRQLNALTREMVVSLGRLLEEIAQDDACRVLILTGSGRGFCAGQDVQQANARNSRRQEGVVDKLGWQERFAALPVQLQALPQIVIAAVNGPCVGIGLALALAADIRLASRSARFLPAALALGLTSGESGLSYLLPRLIGVSRAYDIMLTGREIGIDEAERTGLVAEVVDDDALLEAARARAERLAGASPFGLRQTKRLLRRNVDAVSLAAAIEAENSAQVLAASTEDYREGTAAFAARRTPRFTGA